MASIPLSYNIRSLFVRKTTTAATALGVGLVVFVFAAAGMLSEGIRKTLGSSGSADAAIVLSKGADSELSSSINVPDIGLITSASQVRQANGKPNAVGEVVGVVALDKLGTDGFSNVQIRGTNEDAWVFRDTAKLIEGRKARPGADEVVIGRGIRGRFRGVDLGQSFEIRKNRNVKVVGVFEDRGSSYESEVWADVDTVRTAFGREGLVSSVRVRLRSENDFEAFKRALTSNRQLGVDVERETIYYEKQSQNLAQFIQGIGFVIAFFFSIGAMIGAMITMYSAVANRTREIGTLRALGFSRSAILFSFLFESFVLSMFGGTCGALASLVMGLVRFSTVNFASWSEIVFSFEPTAGTVISAVVFAAFIGIVGGIFPAVRAARVQVLAALRA